MYGNLGCLVRSEFAELGSIDACEAVGGGAKKVVGPIAVEDGDAAAALLESLAHILRQEVVTVVLFGVFVEQAVVKVDKFLAIGRGDLVQIADDPADLLKVPVVSQPDEAVVGGDVRGEGELTAAEGAEVALAEFRTAARHQVHVAWRLSFHLGHVDGVSGAFIPAQAMPKLGVGLEVSPLFFESNGHCHANVTAKGFA